MTVFSKYNAVEMPPEQSVRSFTDAKEAVLYLQDLYQDATGFLRQKFSEVVQGDAPEKRFRAFYPEIRITTTSYGQIDSRLSFGHVAEPGTYATTVTRPDLFKYYLRQQIALLIENHGVAVQIGRDGEPVIYEEAEQIARFHAAALLPTGEPSPKQKGNPGRPKTYRKPEGEAWTRAQEWWAGPLHWEDVGVLLGQMSGTKPVSRATMNKWLGNRPPCPGRSRKPRSDKRKG